MYRCTILGVCVQLASMQATDSSKSSIDLVQLWSRKGIGEGYKGHVKGRLSTPLFFLDDNTIVVTYSTGGTQRDVLSSPPLSTALVDVSKGETIAQRTWQASFPEFSIMPVEDSRLVVLDRHGLTIFDRSLHELRSVAHPKESVEIEGAAPDRRYFPDVNPVSRELRVSPTGRTIAAIHAGGHAAFVSVYDTLRLGNITSFIVAPFLSSDISDTQFVTISAIRSSGGSTVARLYSFDHRSDQEERSQIVGNCNESHFLTPGTILVAGGCSDLILLSDAGDRLSDISLGRFWASNIAVARSNGTFVANMYEILLGRASLDRGLRIKDRRLVLFSASLARVATLIADMRTNAQDPGEYALSPNGKLLAFLQNDLLVLYEVPGPEKSSSAAFSSGSMTAGQSHPVGP